jgi:alpha-L-fucosidase
MPNKIEPPEPLETPEQREARMKWWHDGHFGMFIHFGLYSGLAGEYKNKPIPQKAAEWYQSYVGIDDMTYDSMAKPLFHPAENCTKEWAALAKRAGCEYAILTTKHHEGFCLFESKYGDHTSKQLIGRDLVKEYMDTFRNEGLKPGLYHSLIDWHHPQYDNRLAKGIPYPKDEAEKRKETSLDHSQYSAYLHNQIDEILKNYGEPSELWFDFSSPEFDGEEAWGGVTLLNKIRKEHPNVIVNNRLFKRNGSGNGDADGSTKFDYRYGDIITPEQFVPPTGIPGVNWESCMTLNDTWGYNKYDHNYKSKKDLIQTLCKIVSRGGNFLLNIGPRGDGSLTQETYDAFDAIGAWMKINSEAIKGTRASPFGEVFEWGVVTRKESILYLHVFELPASKQLGIPIDSTRVNLVQVLGGNGCSTTVSGDRGRTTIEVQGQLPHPYSSVIKILLN